MLAICLMLSVAHYAQNYVGIIGEPLLTTTLGTPHFYRELDDLCMGHQGLPTRTITADIWKTVNHDG